MSSQKNVEISNQPIIATIGFFILSLAWLNANHFNPWLCFESESLTFVAVAFVLISRLLIRRVVSVPRIIGWLIFIFFLPWLQYSSGISLFAGDAWLGCFYQTGLLMAIMVGYEIADGDNLHVARDWLALAHAVWVAALISAAIGLTQWFSLADYLGIYAIQTDIGARAAGNLAQPNQLATLLLMGMAALVYVYQQKIIGKVGLSMAVTFMSAVLVLAQSRAAMVSVVAIATFLIWKQGSAALLLPKSAVLWWVVGFAAATLSLPGVSDFLLQGEVRSLTATESVSERWLIWKQVTYAIAQAPWLGYGWNQTATANAVGALAFPGSTPYTNAHNIMLDLMVWCGMPIGLLLTGGMAYWLVTRLRACHQSGAVLAMAGLLPIGIHSLLEFPFAYAYFLIAAGFFVGIIEAGHTPVRSVAIKSRWLWLLLCVWGMLGGYMAYEYLQIEEDFRVVRFENLRVGDTPSGYQVPQVSLLSHMAAMLSTARQAPKPDMSQTELENLRKVSDRFVYGAIRFKYAQALGLNGDPAGASRQMQIIHGMYGDYFYKACKEEMLQLSSGKYPQLARVSW